MPINSQTSSRENRIIRPFLQIIFPIALLLLGLGLWSSQIVTNKELEKFKSEQAAILDIRVGVLSEDIDDYLEKILAISVDPFMVQALNETSQATLKQLEISFESLLLRNHDFFEIRWIDETGREKVRVDRNGDKIIVASTNALQDKSQRYFFKDAMKLSPRKVYVSPLDLKVEHGRIEVPFKPTLRFAVKLIDSREQTRGIVIINVNANKLLDKIPRKHFTDSQLMWLNEAGYWLRASDPKDEWGFEQDQSNTFIKRYPDVWKAMAQHNQTSLLDAQGLWSWRVVDLRKGERGAAIDQAPSWHLVSLLSADTINALYVTTLAEIAPILLVSLMILSGISFLQVRSREQLKRREQEREILLSRIQRTATRLPGVVYEYRLNPDGSACFPYASEAIRVIYRVSPQEVQDDAAKVFAVLHPEDLERVKASIHTSADTLTPWNEEYRVKFEDGTVHWLSGNALPQKQADGTVLWHGFIQDITQRKDEEIRYHNLVEQLRATVNSALDCIVVADPQSRIIEFNPAAERCFGYRRTEVIGTLLSDKIIPERYRAAHLEGMRHYLKTGEGPVLHRRIEIEAIRRDGSEFPIELAIEVAQSDNEKLFVAYLRDITERKQAEKKLLQSKAELKKLALVASLTDNVVIFTDKNGCIEWVNDGFTRVTGWQLEEVLARKPGEFLQGPETDPATVQTMSEAIRAGCGVNVEILNYHRDGHTYWLCIEIQPVRDDAGEIMGFMAMERDITERKHAQAALEDYSQRLEELVEARTDALQWNAALLGAVFKTSPNGLLLISRDGKIRMTNIALNRMFGYDEAELLNSPLERLVPISFLEQHNNLCETFIQEPYSRPMDKRLEIFGQRRDGSLFPIDISLATFTVNEEQFIQATVADITERKHAEEALLDLNANLEWKVEQRTEQLAAASAAKSEFLANMSHEIRTPMNGILGLAQLLEHEPLTPDQKDMIARIRQAGYSLLTIINDVLDFSKIEAGQLKIDPQPFKLAPMLAQITSLMGPSAHAKGIDFYIESPPDWEGNLIGDCLRLEQILINLIGNAIKFTEKGEIHVAVHPLALTETFLRLRFEVRDSGIGIAPDQVKMLFIPFVQADKGITRRFGGTGLGLSICKRLVELMDGEIGVESTPRQGSTFWFELPFTRSLLAPASPPLPAPRAASEEPRLRGIHCLVVDDSRMNREMVERALTREGARVTLAVDGQQALQYLKAQNENQFDAVLMDMQMPILDGFAATRTIRADLGLKDLPVIAFTAGVLPEQREQAKAAGCSDFLAKPVDLEELIGVILRWTSLIETLPPAPVVELSSILPDIPGLDIGQARALLGDDRNLFLAMLKSFAEEFGMAAIVIRDDLRKRDRESAARRLHTLRGAAGFIGATELIDSAQLLENVIKEQAPGVEPLIEKFEQKLNALLKASEPWRQ